MQMSHRVKHTCLPEVEGILQSLVWQVGFHAMCDSIAAHQVSCKCILHGFGPDRNGLLPMMVLATSSKEVLIVAGTTQAVASMPEYIRFEFAINHSEGTIG